MRSILLIIIIVTVLADSCTMKATRLTSHEKGWIRGFHANEAHRIIEANNKNRKANQKHAEKNKAIQTERLNELNHYKDKKAASRKNTAYSFY